jgi:hypothetical protein
MSKSATAFSIVSEFDTFLLASIGEEKNGMLLSVLSALARLDVDPWSEAAELARMPSDRAGQRLTSLIDALPDAPSTRPEPAAIAARLVALLPRDHRLLAPQRKNLPEPSAGMTSRTLFYVIVVNLLLAFATSGAQWAAMRLHSSEPVGGAARASASGPPLPQKLFPPLSQR